MAARALARCALRYPIVQSPGGLLVIPTSSEIGATLSLADVVGLAVAGVTDHGDASFADLAGLALAGAARCFTASPGFVISGQSLAEQVGPLAGAGRRATGSGGTDLGGAQLADLVGLALAGQARGFTAAPGVGFSSFMPSGSTIAIFSVSGLTLYGVNEALHLSSSGNESERTRSAESTEDQSTGAENPGDPSEGDVNQNGNDRKKKNGKSFEDRHAELEKAIETIQEDIKALKHVSRDKAEFEDYKKKELQHLNGLKESLEAQRELLFKEAARKEAAYADQLKTLHDGQKCLDKARSTWHSEMAANAPEKKKVLIIWRGDRTC